MALARSRSYDELIAANKRKDEELAELRRQFYLATDPAAQFEDIVAKIETIKNLFPLDDLFGIRKQTEDFLNDSRERFDQVKHDQAQLKNLVKSIEIVENMLTNITSRNVCLSTLEADNKRLQKHSLKLEGATAKQRAEGETTAAFGYYCTFVGLGMVVCGLLTIPITLGVSIILFAVGGLTVLGGGSLIAVGENIQSRHPRTGVSSSMLLFGCAVTKKGEQIAKERQEESKIAQAPLLKGESDYCRENTFRAVK